MKKLKKSIFYKDIILKYFEEVEKGNECKHQKKLVVFLKKIFDEEELFINDEQAKAYFKNEELFPFDLFLWEKFAFLMHNCLYTKDGEPRFSDLFLYVGRGAGKNGYLSFEDFCLLTPANNIKQYDIDICSNTEEQSRTSFDDIYNILDANEKFFKKYFVWTKTYIKNRKTNSTLRYRTNNPKSKDGLRSGKVDFDECFTGDTEILTNKGYVRFDELKDEKVAQWNDGIIEFVKPTRKIKRIADEIVVNNLGYGKTLKTTKNHNIVYTDNGKIFTEKAINKVNNGHVVLRGKLKDENKHLTDEERLIICTQADGSICTYQRKDQKYTRYQMKFKKERKNKRFLSLNPKNLSKINYRARHGYYRYSYTLNTPHAKRLDKCFNLEDFDYTKAKEFIDEVAQWDGTIRNSGAIEYSSVVKENADFVSAVATLCGYSVTTSVEHDNRKDSYNDVYRVRMNKNIRLKADTFNKNKQVIKYNDYVYCVEVPSHKIVIKSDGKSLICGNCHQYENMENINVFTTGLGKKKHPKKTFITTNGNVRDGVLDSYLLKSRNILDFEIVDNGFLPMLWEIDEKEDVYDPQNWNKANPSLKYRKDLLTEMKKEFEDFKLDEISNSSFLNKRMNYPEIARDCEVASWQNIEKTNREVINLDGKKCFVGIDSSSSTDFFSVVLLFKVGDIYYTKQHSWFCWESNDRSRIKIPLEEFEKKGLLTIVHQKQIPPSLAFEWLNKERIKHGYIYAKYVIDYYRFSFISNELYKHGIDKSMIKLDRPFDIMFVQPKIDSLFKGHKLIWGDDALMRWFTNNTKLIPCENNNYKYGKIEPKSRKTDGFFALVASFTAEKEEQLDNNTVFLRPFAL